MFNKKRSSKNLRIGTRITISTILGIIIPLLIVSAVFRAVHYSPSAPDISSVTAKSFSLISQIQWGRTVNSISNELLSGKTKSEKQKNISSIASSAEKAGFKFLIESKDGEIYSTGDKNTILKEAASIINTNRRMNINYFGQNGMLIQDHVKNGKNESTIIIANSDYTVPDISKATANSYSSYLAGNGFMIIFIIILLFTASIASLSFITSKTIVKPLKKLSAGANEIAKGNLDYRIDYESTNEIGQTVSAFNDMAAQLKHSIDERDRLEQSRKEMIAGVAHDLRTPLTSVKGYVEGLRDGIANTEEKRKRYLDTIYDSTVSMDNLLDELLTISRLELKSITLNTEKIGIGDFISNCEKDMRTYLEANNFELKTINNCSNDGTLTVDTERFSRVIQNIVSNSVKYARKGIKGKVVFEAQEYEKSIILSISDNGIGIESENLSKIFETFFRADKSRTKVKEGSGLGLAVCRQIVELHGGHIWATKNEDSGLTILISLRKDSEENE